MRSDMRVPSDDIPFTVFLEILEYSSYDIIHPIRAGDVFECTGIVREEFPKHLTLLGDIGDVLPPIDEIHIGKRGEFLVPEVEILPLRFPIPDIFEKRVPLTHGELIVTFDLPELLI